MTSWIRWQVACLADDIRRTRNWLRRLWRRWWLGQPGRHGTWHDYHTSELAAIEADLAERLWPADLAEWPLDAAPALLSAAVRSGVSSPPAPGPELPPEDDWTAEAELRGLSPHVFAPDADYWTYAWSAFSDDFDETRAWDEYEANVLRVECGLPPRPLALPQILRELNAA